MSLKQNEKNSITGGIPEVQSQFQTGAVDHAGRQVPIFSYFSQHTPIFPIF